MRLRRISIIEAGNGTTLNINDHRTNRCVCDVQLHAKRNVPLGGAMPLIDALAVGIDVIGEYQWRVWPKMPKDAQRFKARIPKQSKTIKSYSRHRKSHQKRPRFETKRLNTAVCSEW